MRLSRSPRLSLVPPQPALNAVLCTGSPALQRLWAWLGHGAAQRGLGVGDLLALDAAALRALAAGAAGVAATAAGGPTAVAPQRGPLGRSISAQATLAAAPALVRPGASRSPVTYCLGRCTIRSRCTPSSTARPPGRPRCSCAGGPPPPTPTPMRCGLPNGGPCFHAVPGTFTLPGVPCAQALVSALEESGQYPRAVVGRCDVAPSFLFSVAHFCERPW